MNRDKKVRLFGLIGLATIAGWLTLSLGNSFYLSIVSSRWPKVPVRITSSEVSTGTSNMGTWWVPDVKYEYRLRDRAYHSSTIRYLMQSFFDQEKAENVLAAYPARAEATAAYDPQNPARSVLEPGVPSSMWSRALVPLFFWVLAAYIFCQIFYSGRKPPLAASAEGLGQD